MVILCGCSHFNKTAKETENQNNSPGIQLKNLCWTGDGRARFVDQAERHLLSFSSEIIADKSIWRLAISVPLKGEEIFELDFQHRKVVLPGGRKNLAESKQFMPWQFFISTLSDFFQWTMAPNQSEPNCKFLEESRRWECFIGNNPVAYQVLFKEGQLEIWGNPNFQSGPEGMYLKANDYDSDQKYFKVVEVQRLGQNVEDKSSAKFFFKSCQRN